MSRIRQFGWDIALVIIAIILVVVLWCLGFKEISVLTLILGFAIWIIEKKIDQQNQIILQASQAGFDFKAHVTQEMFEATKELWKQVVWLAMNRSALYPGPDKNEERRQGYLNQFKHFEQYLTENSILLPKDIYNSATQLGSAVNQYRSGRDIQTMGGEARDIATSREGGQMMAQGDKDLVRAFNDLPEVIRKEFGLEELPGAIIKPELPKPANDKS